MNTVVFRRSLQWTAIVLCLLFVALYAWQYLIMEEPLPDYGKAADFTMESSEGGKVNMASLNNKARLVYFFFASCPDVCSPTTKKLADVQKRLAVDGIAKEQLELISITVDPRNDSPESLNQFASKNGADLDNWSFLYGDEKQTVEIAKKYEVGVTRDADNRLLHNNQVILVDQQGKIRQFYEDLPDKKIDYEQIETDVRSLF